MCGILVAFNKKERIDVSACNRALSILSWRGPDITLSFVVEDILFLGQTVLSITGNPINGNGEYLRSISGRYYLLFNGEIYNHQSLQEQFLKKQSDFSLHYGTDTEILVNLHEVLEPEEVQSQLDGMFAYILFDSLKRKLYISRDVQGEKSLFIYENSTWLVISSEIRSILSLVPSISLDPQALRDYFKTRHLMLFERTVYSGIKNLMPGRLETFDLVSHQWLERQVVRIRDWINPQRLKDNESRSLDNLADELDEIINRCVIEMIPKRQRYAIVVSGGVDSSLLAHYFITNDNPHLLIAVNHKGKDLISCDLSGFENILGRKIDVLEVDAVSYAAEIPRCQKVCASPIYSHSFIPQSIQSSYIRANGCRVLIGGEGGDEYFGGYPAYLKCIGTNGCFSPSPYTRYQSPIFSFSDDKPGLFEQILRNIWVESLDAYSFIGDEQEHIIQAMLFCDAVYQLPAVGLRGADLMSMMWSVETRSVYMRKPIVQFALNLPAKMKVNTEDTVAPLLKTKPLLKCLFLRYFPKELLFEKQGFSGFPNESAKYLGLPYYYKAINYLSMHRDSIPAGLQDRDSEWKLINVEYFLRSNFTL